MNDYKIEEIKIDYIKEVTKLLLFIIAGEVTLLGTLFKNYSDKTYAEISIILMLFAVFLTLSIAESIIRRISKKPNFKNYFMIKFVNLFSTSVEMEWIKSSLAAIFIFLSLFLYILFIFN